MWGFGLFYIMQTNVLIWKLIESIYWIASFDQELFVIEEHPEFQLVKPQKFIMMMWEYCWPYRTWKYTGFDEISINISIRPKILVSAYAKTRLDTPCSKGIKDLKEL